ncbi:MAG TPA: hypothetical protein VF053_21050 [Streptosporangiales bacterium]
MGFLDRAKEAAQRAKSQARVAREQGQQRLEELQARRQAEMLLREVGIAAYEEHRGESDHEAVVRALARLDAHLRNHPLDLSTGGLRGYMRTAAGGYAESTPASAPTSRDAGEPGAGTAGPETEDAGPAGPAGPETEGERPTEPKADPADNPGPAAKKTAKKSAKKTAKKAAKKATAKKVAKKTAKKAAASPDREPDRPE